MVAATTPGDALGFVVFALPSETGGDHGLDDPRRNWSELIAREAKKRGAVPVLAGRDAAKIAELARDLSFRSKVFTLDAPTNVAAALAVKFSLRPQLSRRSMRKSDKIGKTRSSTARV